MTKTTKKCPQCCGEKEIRGVSCSRCEGEGRVPNPSGVSDYIEEQEDRIKFLEDFREHVIETMQSYHEQRLTQNGVITVIGLRLASEGNVPQEIIDRGIAMAKEYGWIKNGLPNLD